MLKKKRAFVKKAAGTFLAAGFLLCMGFSAQAAGWIQGANGTWSYQKEDGSLAAGEWIYDKMQWYYLKADKTAASGWEQIDGDWYYFLDGGAMATRWIQVDGKWYYMNLDGKMVSDTVIRNHVIGEDGAWIEVPESARMEITALYDIKPSYIWDAAGTTSKSTGTDGKSYEKNIMISGKSCIEYDLDGEQTRFTCRIVPRSGFSSDGSVTIVIYGDYDEPLYTMEDITRDTEPERIDVDIIGQHILGVKCIPDSDSEGDTVLLNWPSVYK